MLAEERHKLILEKLNIDSVVYQSELVDYLKTSESTIRRDLNYLHEAGLLKKVHGGAVKIDSDPINTKDEKVEIRQSLHMDDKLKIARAAAGLIDAEDFVYIDAGTTTELMINFINEKKAVFVTNGIVHAKKLIERGFTTYIIGGELKPLTEAIIGVEAVNSLKKYNFTKGFFGTNGIDEYRGFTTPDIREALVKEEAIKRSKEAFVLADKSKFSKISSVCFAETSDAKVITTDKEEYKSYEKIKIIEV